MENSTCEHSLPPGVRRARLEPTQRRRLKFVGTGRSAVGSLLCHLLNPAIYTRHIPRRIQHEALSEIITDAFWIIATEFLNPI